MTTNIESLIFEVSRLSYFNSNVIYKLRNDKKDIIKSDTDEFKILIPWMNLTGYSANVYDKNDKEVLKLTQNYLNTTINMESEKGKIEVKQSDWNNLSDKLFNYKNKSYAWKHVDHNNIKLITLPEEELIA
ncbi:hypothetical protein HK099_007970 [Clydaea vesicula]|uniref:Uncharacterized protein n=1 Tax=Clydaea vesicula TaxID=447962 RepID=A0AAD5XY61_9FUNG|nr:hypothetical protein HK099_007970 [Clydaea vesicula]KAJ3384231.1 hypothetical protein HDU92_003707 [Lobulomyces angularis]